MAWLHFLRQRGLRNTSTFLEFGCGLLDLAGALLPFLQRRDAYACIEPNRFLPLTALAQQTSAAHALLETVLERRASFSFRSDFLLDENVDGDSQDDTRGVGEFSPLSETRRFDFIFAHSVMSHFGTTQLDPFFAAVKRQLAFPDGLGVFSLCLCSICSSTTPAPDEATLLALEDTGNCEASGEEEW